ncbi:CU044_5270 family protein [Amycolatopsis silviterrae]|uniref:CU044_5270 family protein n=1 Tax=Amycolatopsis silviterrae TaxID=1656914 RepID=A0ABW5HBZ8_9PSEU
MDEMKLLRERTADVPLPALDDLAPVREKLLAEARAEGKPNKAKWAIGIAAAAAAAAAIVPLSSGGQPAAADPVKVLHDAAQAALRKPDMPPGPGQFLYVKKQTSQGTREEWLSGDGERDGYVRQEGKGMPVPVCVDGKCHPVGEKVPEKQPCQKEPAYKKGAPETAGAMYQYLGGGSAAMGENFSQIASETYLEPKARAAMYDAVAQVSGLSAVENARDAAGRQGVGVSWDGTTLVFDPATHAYLGTTKEALVSYGIVDRAGQLPG